jgi:chemotaxis protein methyltransferase WspC
MKSFVEVAMPDVLGLLARRLGLNPESVGLTLIQHAVEEHMDDLGLDDATDYVQRLHGSQEFDELIERVVVPETWFFRDLEPFRCVQHFVRKQWRPQRVGERLRVLNIPSSTGEEPYSVAITLLDLGLTAGQFVIDGVDISRRHIEQARLGRFTGNSFRETHDITLQPVNSFFHSQDDRLILTEHVRTLVHFTRANLASADFLFDANRYHIIFCRNLLIYLTPEAREQALAHFRRLLEPGGFIYFGHAESAIATNARLAVMDRQFPFAFQFDSTRDEADGDDLPSPSSGLKSSAFFKLPSLPLVADDSLFPLGLGSESSIFTLPDVVSVADDPPPPPDSASKSTAVFKLPDRPRPQPPRPPAAPVASVAPESGPAEIDRLALARAAADAGQLGAAAQHCQQVLAEAATSAEAYCLLGTIRQAQGDVAGAEQSFQKALYLDPSHHESLVHLGLLAQRRGDATGAANFRRRAERLGKGEPKP